MNSQKLQVKLYVEAAEDFRLAAFVPVFHSWIRKQALPELMIDVADYGHVHHGPGVVLIGHASDYFIDMGEGRPGLLYSRKREAAAPAERLRDAFRRALHACFLLEREPMLQGLRFATHELLIRIPDRLYAPNEALTFTTVGAQISEFLDILFDGSSQLLHEGSAREPFTVRVRSAKAPDVATLLDRVGGPPSA
jgi:hypothetical protein